MISLSLSLSEADILERERERVMDHFARLPEGCISEILSFTSAMDAMRSAILSKEFKSAAEGDGLWEKFLPPDYQEIISTSVSSPVEYATKKDLYFSLCHSPLLINGGNMVTIKYQILFPKHHHIFQNKTKIYA